MGKGQDHRGSLYHLLKVLDKVLSMKPVHLLRKVVALRASDKKKRSDLVRSLGDSRAWLHPGWDGMGWDGSCMDRVQCGAAEEMGRQGRCREGRQPLMERKTLP